MRTRAQFYKNLIPQINQIAHTTQTPEELVFQLNDLILDNQISDKPISYTSQANTLASWNIACGSKWVNPKDAVGAPAAGLSNPTFNKEGHAERMNCCAAILNALKQKGMHTIAIQEAPASIQDAFYTKANAQYGNAKGNIRVAVMGAAVIQAPGNISSLMAQYGIGQQELLVAQNPQGQFIVDVHLDWKPASTADRTNRVNFLNALISYASQSNLPLFVMGDSNLDYKDMAYAPCAACFGAHGCSTVDVIMNPAIQQVYLDSYKNAKVSPAASFQAPHHAPSIQPVHASPSNGPSSSPSIAVSSSGNTSPRYSGAQTSSVSSPSSSGAFFGKIKNLFGGAPKPEPRFKELSLLDKLEDEKKGLEVIIKEHGYALKTIDLGKEKQKYQDEFDQATQKMPLLEFKIAYLKDFKAKPGAKSKGGINEKIEKDEIKSIDEVLAYAKANPGSRTERIVNQLKLVNEKAPNSPAQFFGTSPTDSFNKIFGLNKDDMQVYKGKTGMVQCWFKTQKDAVSFENTAWGLYEGADPDSAIVTRQDSPLIIRLSEKQYQAMCDQFKAEKFPVYASLASAPAATRTPQKKQ